MTKKLKSPSEIVHDPVMWERFVEAMNAATDLENNLQRKDNDVQKTRSTPTGE